ncbi:MAG TPA: hypothetical protein PL029_08305 [Bacteroidia bacterium]|nr:hypothetical protein [Bacteroidia bacterium]
MEKQNILVVCWDFPPNNSIGGRRWAKISKSFLKLGHSVSVIATTPIEYSQKSAWISPEDLSKIKLYYCPGNLLERWLNDYNSPLRFFRIRFAKLLLKLLYGGTIFDKAIGVQDKFIAIAREVIKNDKIHTLFVTGTPFNLLYYSALLKKEFQDLRIVADYRDPWLGAQNYGMQTLSPARKNFEIKKQNYVFEHVDYVCAPNPVLLQEIKNTYTGSENRLAEFIELPHAFDPDDVVPARSGEGSSGKIKIIYAGTVYLGIEKYLRFLNEAIAYVKQKGPGLAIELSFYTYQKEQESIFSDNRDLVKFSDSIGDGVFKIARSSDFILILLSEHNKNYVTSKFFEFLPYQKPYLYVGPPGLVSDKIVNEGLGYYLKQKEDLYHVLTSADRLQPSGASIEKYSFDAVTKNLLKVVNSCS